MGVLIKNKINYSGNGASNINTKLLWESDNTTMAEGATITIDNLQLYDFIGIETIHNSTTLGRNALQWFKNIDTLANHENVLYSFSSGDAACHARTFTISGNTLTFSNGMQPGVAYNTGYTVPMKIYGTMCASNNSYSSYSIEEHVVGTWVDGSPIYEKTYTITNISSNYTVVDLELATSTINLIWIHEGFAVNGVYCTGNVVPYASSSAAGELGMCGYINKNTNTVEYHYRSGSYLSGGTAYITFRYVKA